MPYDFTCMWNLKDNMNEQTKQIASQTQGPEWWLLQGMGFGGLGKKGEGIEKVQIGRYKTVIRMSSTAWEI